MASAVPRCCAAYLSEAVTARDLVYSGVYSLPEVLGPSFVTFAAPELSAAMIPLFLRGDEVWCQGFSEPGTGSNLGSLTCRAVRTDGRMAGHRPEGLDEPGPVRAAVCAPDADRNARVGPPGHHRAVRRHGHRRASRPGRSRRCTESRSSPRTFFDDVLVPFDRTLGEERRGLGVRHGPVALRAQHVVVAAGRVPPPPAAGPARRGRPGASSTRSSSAR